MHVSKIFWSFSPAKGFGLFQAPKKHQSLEVAGFRVSKSILISVSLGNKKQKGKVG